MRGYRALALAGAGLGAAGYAIVLASGVVVAALAASRLRGLAGRGGLDPRSAEALGSLDLPGLVAGASPLALQIAGLVALALAAGAAGIAASAWAVAAARRRSAGALAACAAALATVAAAAAAAMRLTVFDGGLDAFSIVLGGTLIGVQAPGDPHWPMYAAWAAGMAAAFVAPPALLGAAAAAARRGRRAAG